MPRSSSPLPAGYTSESRVTWAPDCSGTARIAFRSSLEAKWSRFWSGLGLQWEYEPEAFLLPTGRRYTPDFRVTGTHGGEVFWVEIKPGMGAAFAVSEKLEAAASVIRATGARFFILARPAPSFCGWAGSPVGIEVQGGEGLVRSRFFLTRTFMSPEGKALQDSDPDAYSRFVDMAADRAESDAKKEWGQVSEEIGKEAANDADSFDSLVDMLAKGMDARRRLGLQ